MNNCIDLILGKAFCIFIFFYFRDSRLSVLKDFHFYFCFLTWVKTENIFVRHYQQATHPAYLFSSAAVYLSTTERASRSSKGNSDKNAAPPLVIPSTLE